MRLYLPPKVAQTSSLSSFKAAIPQHFLHSISFPDHTNLVFIENKVRLKKSLGQQSVFVKPFSKSM